MCGHPHRPGEPVPLPRRQPAAALQAVKSEQKATGSPKSDTSRDKFGFLASGNVHYTAIIAYLLRRDTKSLDSL